MRHILMMSALFICRSMSVEADDTTTLRVITYNVQFLPPPADLSNKRAQPEYRARRIAEELGVFDVACLQETFHKEHRQQLIDGTRDVWGGTMSHFEAPQPEGFLTNGGCLLMSRRPLVKTSSVVFQNFSLPKDYGLRADGYAAKGVIHGRISRSDEESENTIDVFVTHLEARADDLRPLQYAEMAKFIGEASDPARPMLLVGDLNTHGARVHRDDPQSQYAQLIQALNEARPTGVIDVWPLLHPDKLGGTSEQESEEIGKRIDYIIVSNPPSPAPQLVPKSIRVEPFQDEQVFALSDHNAVIADFEWRSPTTMN